MTSLKRVLILEENTDHLELLKNVLENHFAPIDIHTVETIEDCLDFLEETQYDLILTGCFIHSTKITERLEEMASLACGSPIIVVSGSGNENIAAEAIKKGASDYIVKTRKTLEKIPSIVEKYFKKTLQPAKKKPKKESTRTDSVQLLRELDHLMQKARQLTANIASTTVPLESQSLESLFSQINRLRKLLQEQK